MKKILTIFLMFSFSMFTLSNDIKIKEFLQEGLYLVSDNDGNFHEDASTFALIGKERLDAFLVRYPSKNKKDFNKFAIVNTADKAITSQFKETNIESAEPGKNKPTFISFILQQMPMERYYKVFNPEENVEIRFYGDKKMYIKYISTSEVESILNAIRKVEKW